MKILHTVENYFPSVGGMQEVVKQLSERLVKLGHKVTVAAGKHPERTQKVINGVQIADFCISGNLVSNLTGEIEKYKDLLVNSDFDIITNFAAQQWATDAALTALKKIRAKKVFVPTGFSAFHNPNYQKYFEEMKTWLKMYDMNIFLSDDYRDINFAKKNGIENRILIPNGAGADEFLKDYGINMKKRLNIPEHHFLILHVGSHTKLKGHKEAIEVYKKSRLKNTTFVIVANNFESGCQKECTVSEKKFNNSFKRFIDGKKLIITSLSREETVSLYKEADLFFFASNIECSPLVLFECMASKTPFLTTDVGNAAEIIGWSGGGLLLPTEKDFEGYSRARINEAREILEMIYRDSNKREELKQFGYKAWIKRFTWEKIAKDYEKLYVKLVENGKQQSIASVN